MLTSTTTTMLRGGVARSTGVLQPILIRTTMCPYSTTTTSGQKTAAKPRLMPAVRPLSIMPTPTTKCTDPLTLRFRHQMTQRRQASTTTTRQPTDTETDARAAEAVAARQAAAHPEQALLDWNTFFQLRKTRRRLQQAFSVAGALGGGVGGALFLSTGAAEAVVGKIPLDPFVTLGLMTFSFSALGWLVGPVLGTVVFNVFKSRFKSQMAVKESQFFARIKKHRVDPTSSSVQNPVPDFYGEKISSVAGYRQWLKDQRAFLKKRGAPFIQ
ncbi:mitochondrial import protein Pam17-domain-containing protein [Echria macrotheca]|uniref:Presequence translocated-associated motor subunit PAM17 n=1 Tax=Echria macrotheca TaxID=438768 RepID=A0AAJ0F7F9_9PEZI|nr:mitochondrial import protein Pam17-domain-containing protein [Echria macrotheca]